MPKLWNSLASKAAGKPAVLKQALVNGAGANTNIAVTGLKKNEDQILSVIGFELNPTAGGAVAATGTIDPAGANNALVYTARDAGDAGNGISVRYLGSTGNNVALSVAVNGNDIVVTPATDGGGLITSTGDDVAAAIAASGPANALVSVADAAANDGSGLVAATGPTSLTGGADAGTSYAQTVIDHTATVTIFSDGNIRSTNVTTGEKLLVSYYDWK